MEKNEIGFVDYLSFLVKWRKVIIITFITVCVLAAGLSLILPKWYKANTTILPPVEEGSDLGISSLLSSIPFSGAGLGLGIMSEQTSLFLAIVNSRSVMEKVIHKFDLANRYKSKNMEETLKTLRSRVTVKVNEEGTISLSCFAKTKYFGTKDQIKEAKQIVMEMANFYIDELDRVNKRLKVDRARNTRIFIEGRYIQNLEDLRNAEETFKAFQEKYGAIALPEQTTATISAAAEFTAQIMIKEVELGLLGKSVGESHSEYRRTLFELEELQKKYDQFQLGRERSLFREGNEPISKDLFLPLDEIPDLGLQYARCFREVKLQETIMEFLLPQYEQAKIREARDTPTVQILDPAVLPILRARPRRAIFVAITGLTTLLVLLTFIAIYERVQILRTYDVDKYQKIINIVSTFKNDLRFWERKRSR